MRTILRLPQGGSPGPYILELLCNTKHSVDQYEDLIVYIIARKSDRQTRADHKISLGVFLAQITYSTIESFRAAPVHALELAEVLSSVLAIEATIIRSRCVYQL